MDLFFPLNPYFVCVPNLPKTMLEYLNMCGHSLIGVEQAFNSDKSNSICFNLSEDEEIDMIDVMENFSCGENLVTNYSI